MTFELCDSENGLITSISIEISKLDNNLKEYLENNVKIKDKRFIINIDNITLNDLKELNVKYNKLISTENSLNKVNDLDEKLQKKLNKAIEEVTTPKESNKILPTQKVIIENIDNSILKLLKERAMNAFEVAAHLGMQTQEISDKLNKMRNQKILTYKIIGDYRYYSIIEQKRN